MAWDQVHIFFDVVSAVGSIVFFVIGLIIKNSIGNLENRIFREMDRIEKYHNKELGRLEGMMLTHGGVCDTDRKNLEYRLQSLESTRRRSQDNFGN